LLDHLNTRKFQSYSNVTLDHLNAQNEAERYLYLFLLAKQGEGLSPKSLKDYEQKIGRFVKGLSPATTLSSIKPEEIQWFLVKLRDTCKPVSVRDYFNNIKNWFNWLEANEYIEKNPMARMKKPRAEKHIIQPFTAQQIKDLLALCDDSFMGIRNRALIFAFLDTGLRLSEMASIRLPDIDYGRGVIKVMGKGSRERVVAIGKTTMAALARYIVARTARCMKWSREPETLWISEECWALNGVGIQTMVKRLGKRAGLQNVRCSPHTFRHTFGTSAILNGASMREAQLLLGHSTDKMTREYTATIDSMFAAERHRNFSPVDRLR